MGTMDSLDQLRDQLLDEIAQAGDLDRLEEVRVAALGKKGRVTARLKELGALDGDARKEMGARLNAVKQAVSEHIETRRAALADAAMASRLAQDRIDVSLPVRPEAEGRIHPISQTLEEVTAIFAEMGFSVAEGGDIEDDFHNFTALNIPPEHPARQMHDTFYLPEREDG